MKDHELVALLGKYNDALIRRRTVPKEFVPSETEMTLWQRYMDRSSTHNELARENGQSVSSFMWLMAKVSRYALGKK